MIQTIESIIRSIDTASPHLNPTVIYNEGWMIRLLVYQSLTEKMAIHGIDFGDIHNWCSEVLMASPFLPRQRGDKHAEGFTHPDMVLGDFSVDFATRGEVDVPKTAKLFGVIEAKMKSKLSERTTNVASYNQASRTVACMAFKTMDTKANIFFVVAAPQAKIAENKLEEDANLDLMLTQIDRRFEAYADDESILQYKAKVLERAQSCEVKIIGYEQWIDEFSSSQQKSVLVEFYEKTKKYNRV